MNASLVEVCATTPTRIFFLSVSPEVILICRQRHLPHMLGSALGTLHVWSHFTFKLSFGETGLSQSEHVTALFVTHPGTRLSRTGPGLDHAISMPFFQALMNKSNTGEVGQNERKLLFFQEVVREGEEAAFYASNLS